MSPVPYSLKMVLNGGNKTMMVSSRDRVVVARHFFHFFLLLTYVDRLIIHYVSNYELLTKNMHILVRCVVRRYEDRPRYNIMQNVCILCTTMCMYNYGSTLSVST